MTGILHLLLQNMLEPRKCSSSLSSSSSPSVSIATSGGGGARSYLLPNKLNNLTGTSSSKEITSSKLSTGTSNTTKQQLRQQKTDSNIYEEEPEVFIMPGQRSRRREKTPESPPLKPPVPMFPDTEDDSPVLKPPPPVPPKTYINIKAKTTPPATPPPAPAPKQSNTEHATKGVKFSADVKFPEEPPPIPWRDYGNRNTSESADTALGTEELTASGGAEVTVMETIAMETASREESVCSEGTEDSGVQSDGDVVVVIMDKKGTQIGELLYTSLDMSQQSTALPST